MLKDEFKFLKGLCKPCKKSFKYLFKYKGSYRKYVNKKILVAGGYGYHNVGDEAQYYTTMKLLRERYIDYEIVSLTPKLDDYFVRYPEFHHELASRVLVFNQGTDFNYYDFNNLHDGSKIKKIFFIIKSLWAIFNARLVRANLPTLCINAETARFLHEIKTAKLFYFCGHGSFTGETLSRLWDAIFICRCCFIMRVPVVVSGVNAGLWGSKFTKCYSRWGFRHVNAFTVRDYGFSLHDLEEIGLSGENYFATHDDALFCEKSEERQIKTRNYITINFHYWGCMPDDRIALLEKIKQIVDYVTNNTEYYLVFVPMDPGDKRPFKEFITKYPNERFTCFDYDFDFRKVRRVIGDSKLCITMRHHPIIFAMGENVPVIALNLMKYFTFKNTGALAQYGMDQFIININDISFIDDFAEKLNSILSSYKEVTEKINDSKHRLSDQKERFLKLVDKIVYGS